MERIKKKMKPLAGNLITLAIVCVLFAVVFILVETGHATRHMRAMLVPICINIILAVSLNLTVGFLGELTLGHAGFMSVGAYAGCLFSIAMKDILPMAARFPLAMLVGGLVAALFGVLIGIPVLRLHGDYLAIVTLAFGEIIRSVIINLEFTGGAAGLKGTPQDSTFVIAFAVVLITLLVIMNLVNSRHGRAITAIRDNRIAAESIGINVTYFKLTVFMLSAFFAGAAGTLYGHFFANVKAASFDYNMSIEILVIVVLGGMGSVPGSIIAAIVLQLLPELMREFADYRMLLYAIVLILVMLATNDPRMREFFERLRPSNLVRKLTAKNKKEAQTDD